MESNLAPAEKTALMRRFRAKNTRPEMLVRSAFHRHGLRFRLHRKDLPGKPDIVMPRYHTVVLVHGCFWHRHVGCKIATTPKTKTEFWQQKFASNVARDKRTAADLEAAGWRVLVIWECEVRDVRRLEQFILSHFHREA